MDNGVTRCEVCGREFRQHSRGRKRKHCSGVCKTRSRQPGYRLVRDYNLPLLAVTRSYIDDLMHQRETIARYMSERGRFFDPLAVLDLDL